MSVTENTLSDCLNNELNQDTLQFSRLDTLSMLTVINQADSTVATALHSVLPELANVVDVIAERLKQGGRIFYVGAGTSGRLAVLIARSALQHLVPRLRWCNQSLRVGIPRC